VHGVLSLQLLLQHTLSFQLLLDTISLCFLLLFLGSLVGHTGIPLAIDASQLFLVILVLLLLLRTLRGG
jgi:hypothetical protein